jgi:hypothetical protein
MMGTQRKHLAKARKVRRHRAIAFMMLEDGKITIDEVLDGDYPVLNGVDIWDILRRSHKLGRAGARRVLQDADVWPHKRVAALDRTERDAIRYHLPPRARKSA